MIVLKISDIFEMYVHYLNVDIKQNFADDIYLQGIHLVYSFVHLGLKKKNLKGKEKILKTVNFCIVLANYCRASKFENLGYIIII